eukprot:2265263-Rhodomonas_salina.1
MAHMTVQNPFVLDLLKKVEKHSKKMPKNAVFTRCRGAHTPCSKDTYTRLTNNSEWLGSDDIDAAMYHASMAFGWMYMDRQPTPTVTVTPTAAASRVLCLNQYLYNKIIKRDGAQIKRWMRQAYIFDGSIKCVIFVANLVGVHWIAMCINVENKQ